MKRNAIARIVIYSLMIAIFSGILMVGLGLNLFTFRTESQGTQVTGEAVSVDADQISWLDLDWAAGSITIRTADTDQITFTESGATERYPMVYAISGGTLSIDYSKKNVATVGNIPSKDLTITVPQDWMCKGLDLDGAALEVKIEGLTVIDFDIDGAANEIVFTGSVQELDCDGASCSLTVTCLERPNQINLDGASIDMELILPENCGFQAQVNGLSCSFRSDLSCTLENEDYCYGDRHCKIYADGLSCKITVNQG